MEVAALHSELGRLQRRLQGIQHWNESQDHLKSSILSCFATFEECEKELRVYTAHRPSQRRRLSGSGSHNMASEQLQRVELQNRVETAQTKLREALNVVVQLFKDSQVYEILAVECVGLNLLDFADSFQDDDVIVSLVLENEALRKKLDENHPTYSYSPEVLRLWMARTFESYQDATVLPGQRVWKVRTPEGRDAVVKRYDGNTERSFLHEVRTLARLRQHPGIISVDAWFRDETRGVRAHLIAIRVPDFVFVRPFPPNAIFP